MIGTNPAGEFSSRSQEPSEEPVRSFQQHRPDQPGLAVRLRRTGPDNTVLAVTGPLDRSGVTLLAQVLDRHRHVHGQRNTRLDLSGLTRIDTAGLSALIRAHHQYRANARQLTLSATQPSYARLSTLTWLNQVLVLDTGSPAHPPTRQQRRHGQDRPRSRPACQG